MGSRAAGYDQREALSLGFTVWGLPTVQVQDINLKLWLQVGNRVCGRTRRVRGYELWGFGTRNPRPWTLNPRPQTLNHKS